MSFFPVPADVMRQVEEARKRTPAVNREALPENALTFDERCELGTGWCAKILANMRGKMDARMQGRPDTPLDEQLAGFGRWGWSSEPEEYREFLKAVKPGPSPLPKSQLSGKARLPRNGRTYQTDA